MAKNFWKKKFKHKNKTYLATILKFGKTVDGDNIWIGRVWCYEDEKVVGRYEIIGGNSPKSVLRFLIYNFKNYLPRFGRFVYVPISEKDFVKDLIFG